MPKKPECTCAEDDWRGAKGHINLTLNGHWPLGESDKYVHCQQCDRFVSQAYADGRKKAMNGEPLYATPDEWWAALGKGTGYNLTSAQVKATAKAERKRLEDEAAADAQTLADNQARGLA